MENKTENDIIYFYVIKLPADTGCDEYHLKGFKTLEEAEEFAKKADKHFETRMSGSKIIKRKLSSFYKGWLF